MQQGGTQAEQPLLLGPIRITAPFELGDNFSRNFIDSERVGEPAVLRSVKSHIRGSQLPDPPQPLKLRRINQVPYGFILHIDVVMYGILEHLLFRQAACHLIFAPFFRHLS
ncbi:hypothetical protein D3C73_1461060 [compost metagenome]